MTSANYEPKVPDLHQATKEKESLNEYRNSLTCHTVQFQPRGPLLMMESNRTRMLASSNWLREYMTFAQKFDRFGGVVLVARKGRAFFS